MSDVFISYSRKDSEIVDRIEQELDKYGITSFIDRSAIDLGDDFAEVIAKALFECQIVLFVWSENSNQSENTANEIALAIDFEKTIVSFKIGTFKSDYKLAYRLVRFNRIDAVPFNEDKIVELGKKLSQQLGKKLKDKSEDKKADNVQERDNVKPSIDKSVHKNVDESKYESSYKFGKSALLEFDLPSAFSDLLEPALNDYKDSRELIAGIVDYRSRIWSIPDAEFDYVKEQADNGNSYAAFIMSCYYKNKHVDNEKSYKYAKESSEKNDSFGIYSLCKCYAIGIGVEKDLPTYLSLLKRSIKAGNNRAILYFAKETLFGWSTRPNPLKGIELLKKAVETNIPEAYSVMGQMYWEGNHILQDMDKAVECYNKAISLGYMEAYDDMSKLYMYEPNTFKTKDPQKGIEWLMKGAEYGEPSCLSAIALCYYFGTGVAQNYSNALKWFLKAAGAGDGFSCYIIGVMYYYGEGVDEDDKLAWDWFKRGAAMFQSNCFYMLGVMCRDSNSPEGKNEDCIKYFEESADLAGGGRNDSLLGLYEIFRTKELEDYIILKDSSNFQEYSWAQKDDKRAMKYLKRAAENEDAVAMLKYGVILTDIELPFSNEIAGLKYLEKALDAGKIEAAIRLGYLYANGIGVPIKIEKAKEYYKQAIDGGAGPVADLEYGKLIKSQYDDDKADEKILEEANVYLKRAAEAELKEAYEPYYSSLMLINMVDDLSTSPNHIEAFRYLNKAVESVNSVQNLIDMGVFHQMGVGTKKDIPEAIKWYKKASLRNDKVSPYNLGEIYFEEKDKGIGNLSAAVYWYGIAQKRKNESAHEKLEIADNERKERIKEIEDNIDVSRLDKYVKLMIPLEIYDEEEVDSYLREFYDVCRRRTCYLPMLNNIAAEYIECKYLPKNLNDLFVDWMNGVESAEALGIQCDRVINEKEDIFPYCSMGIGQKFAEEASLLWLRIKAKYPDKFSDATILDQERLLDIAEREDDLNLQTVLISIVSVSLSVESAFNTNLKLVSEISNNESLQSWGDAFYSGTDDLVRSYAMAKQLYQQVDSAVAKERIEAIDNNFKLYLKD